MMTAAATEHGLALSGDGLLLTLAGAWRLAEMPALATALDRMQPRAPLTVDGEGLTALDSAAALALIRAIDGAGLHHESVTWQGFSAPHRRVLDDVLKRRAVLAEPVPHAKRRWLAEVGERAMIIYRFKPFIPVN